MTRRGGRGSPVELGPQADQPGGCWVEPAGADVEVLEVRFEVHMDPLAASVVCLLSGAVDEVFADALSLACWVDHRVQEEGVGAAVPADLNEADDLLAVERPYPRERVLT